MRRIGVEGFDEDCLCQLIEPAEGLATLGSESVRMIEDRRYPALLGEGWEWYIKRCNVSRI